MISPHSARRGLPVHTILITVVIDCRSSKRASHSNGMNTRLCSSLAKVQDIFEYMKRIARFFCKKIKITAVGAKKHVKGQDFEKTTTKRP